MFDRIRQMVIKEFIQILRDKRMKAIVFVVPVLQTLAFGFAVTTDVNNIPTSVVDLDNSSQSRELVRRFVSSGYFAVTTYPNNPGMIKEMLDQEKDAGTYKIEFDASGLDKGTYYYTFRAGEYEATKRMVVRK